MGFSHQSAHPFGNSDAIDGPFERGEISACGEASWGDVAGDRGHDQVGCGLHL